MLPMTAAFMVVAPILIITGVTIFSIGILYRIREQIIVSSGLILLGLSFVAAVLALNKIDENLMINFGWKYQYVKTLEGGMINPFKGAISPSFIQLGAWTGSTSAMLAASALLILGITLLTYVGSIMLGLEGYKSFIPAIIVLILGFVGVFYQSKSVSALLVQGDIISALKMRELSAWLKVASILLGFIVVTLGAISVYFETKGREYLVYSGAYLLSSLGWGVFSVSFFTAFERRGVLELILTGTVSLPIKVFLLSAILIVIGAVGLLIASTIEVIGSALAGEEVELEEEIPAEEIPEEEVAEAEAAEEAGEEKGE